LTLTARKKELTFLTIVPLCERGVAVGKTVWKKYDAPISYPMRKAGISTGIGALPEMILVHIWCRDKFRHGKRGCELSQPLEISGGAERDRTADLLNAIQALSQLSYSPTKRMHFIQGRMDVNWK
jgi:hypothetical protein